mgnify:CR=1 FL=1
MADLKQFAEQLVNLTVKEVNDLATILKDEYGIEPAAAAVVVAAGGAGGEAGPADHGPHCRPAGHRAGRARGRPGGARAPGWPARSGRGGA